MMPGENVERMHHRGFMIKKASQMLHFLLAWISVSWCPATLINDIFWKSNITFSLNIYSNKGFWNVRNVRNIVRPTVGQCSENAGWQPAGDYIQTSFGPSDRNTFLALGLYVEGFRGEPTTSGGKLSVLGQVKFTFEVNCSISCELVFLSVSVAGVNFIWCCVAGLWHIFNENMFGIMLLFCGISLMKIFSEWLCLKR